MNYRFTAWMILLAIGTFEISTFTGAAQAQDKLDFSRDVRPILSNKCFTCHGPDENAREADLRLDTKEGLFQQAESGETPVVPNDIEASQLLTRIHATDSDQMPPVDSDLTLSATERQVLTRWIQEGAIWQNHWAFISPARPLLPAEQSWSNHPIDRFVFQKLEEQDLSPAQAASPETLLRRVYLDLIGLPPTSEQRVRFLASNDFEHEVEQLLASKHYGEQMATEWLDLARYADSNGYQNDFGRTMWPWRDWVINALNSNQHFDEFIIEQIAGDLLPNPTLDQKIATGFNRNNRTVTEGGSIDEEWLVENVVDRVETTSAALLGLTTGCARCHDHKYDPISQVEFYQLFAFFNNVNEKGVYTETRGNVAPLIKAPTPEQLKRMETLEATSTQLAEKLAKVDDELKEKKDAWLDELSKFDSSNVVEQPVAAKTYLSADSTVEFKLKNEVDKGRLQDTVLGRAASFQKQAQHRIELDDDFQFKSESPFSVTAWVRPEAEGAIISRMDKDKAYRGFDFLILRDGRVNVHLIHHWTDDAIKITTKQKLEFGKWNHVCVTWDGSKKASGLKIFFDTVEAGFDANNDSLKGDTTIDHPIWIGLRGDTPPLKGRVTDIRVFDQELAVEKIRSVFSFPITIIAKTPREQWSEEQSELAMLYFQVRHSDKYGDLLESIAQNEAEKLKHRNSFTTTMIMEERTERRPTYVLDRGVYDQPQKENEILPGVPSFVPGFKPNHLAHIKPVNKDEAPIPDRLALARWLVDKDNPLTARVTVNRIWQHHFGVGLVATPEDFGIQSAPPSHPELLDWLAVEFIESGWDLKRLHRLIVTSKTYQQSSAATEESYRSDPANRWLSRGPRFRLSSETIRDNALAISGLLNPKLGGPPVKPYQPSGLWKELAGGASQGAYVQDKNDNVYRRSLYINRKRTVPPPSMTTFDGGSRETCQVSRQRTNTPLQALALLNDETYLEAARHLAIRAMESSDIELERLSNAFSFATIRNPTKNELKVLQGALAKYTKRFEADPKSAEAFLKVGLSPIDPALDKVDLAAFASVASLILNLDETITRE